MTIVAGNLQRIQRTTPALRRENAWWIFEALREAKQPCSAPEISGLTGLTRPTVDAALEMLSERDWIASAGQAPSAGGRRPTLFETNGGSAWAISVSFYLPEICGAVIDLRGQVVAQITRQLPAAAPRTKALEALAGLLRDLAEAGRKHFEQEHLTRIAAVSIAVAGTLSADRKVSRTLARAAGWKDVPLAEFLDVRLAQMGIAAPLRLERYLTALGAALEDMSLPEPALCMEVSSGVGIGLTGMERVGGVNAGEFGFTLLDPEGPADATGRRGTVEAFLADGPVQRAAAESGLYSDTYSGLYETIGHACAEGHAFAHALAERYAQALANLAALFAPAALRIQGAVFCAGTAFQERVAERFAQRAMHPCELTWGPKDILRPAVALGREHLRSTLRHRLLHG